MFLLVLACCLGTARTADAADYRVVQCANAPHDFVPFSESAGMYVEDKCGSIGGLAVRVFVNAWIAPAHDVMWVAWAPDGTTFSSWQGSFHGGTQPNTGWLPYAVVCADVHCLTPMHYMVAGLENWGNPSNGSWHGAGALRLQFGLTCAWGAADGCRVGAHPPGADMFAPEMTLTDHHAPSPPVLSGGLPGWRSTRHDNTIAFAASDRGGGVDRIVAAVGGGASWTYTAPCWRGNGVYSRLAPCPLTASGAVGINVGALADGRHDLTLTAVDAAGQGATSGPYALFVDNSPPTSPGAIQVVGGEGWRTTDGFSVRWTNPPGQHAPIAAGHWRLCPAAGAGCRTGTVRAAGVNGIDNLSVGKSGDYRLHVWLEDGAGNHDPNSASAPVPLRLDDQAPRAAFEPRDPARPLRLAVDVKDDASGLAGGAVEVHREGSSSWTVLPTTVEGNRLVAMLDDEALPDGRYDVRARAIDGAGNDQTTDRTADGTRMTVQLPIRVLTRLRAGKRVVRVRRVATRRKERKRVVRRRVARMDASPVVRLGKAVPLDGVLESVEGQPLADVDVDVQLVRGPDVATLATVRTDAAGRFRYEAAPTRNETFRLRYRGTSHVRGASIDVPVGVRGASSLRVSDRSVRNGESIVLRGRVGTTPVPSRGKLVEIQAFFRDRWRTFSTVRSDEKGKWLMPYTFGGTVGTVRYRFRARLPVEGGYPYESGVSRVRSVIVRGL